MFSSTSPWLTPWYASMPKPTDITSRWGPSIPASAATLVRSSSGVPSPDSSPRIRMSVPPSTRTTASMSYTSTTARYAARSGWTPTRANAWTVLG